MPKVTARLQHTKNYDMFQSSDDNRDIEIGKHKNLIESLKEYGWLKSKPLSAWRDPNGNGKLIVKDGQHGLAIAQSLQIEIWYVVDDVDFDIAKVNCTPKIWTVWDFAKKYSHHGLKDYREVIEFANKKKVTLTQAAALLAGYSTFNNVGVQFKRVEFRVKEREWAFQVAGIYSQMVSISVSLKRAQFLQACAAVCRLDYFDPARLLDSANRFHELLISYADRDSYLDMIEEVYNKGKQKRVSLKWEAIEALKDRNAAEKSKKNKEEKK